MTTTKPPIHKDAFKAFCRSHPAQTAAARALAARTVAEAIGEKVKAYTRPIFNCFTFTDGRTGARITDPEHLFTCRPEDEELCTRFYQECDTEHRRQGFTGPAGHSPALHAQTNQNDAEYELLKLCGEFFGAPLEETYGDKRKEALDLCMKSVFNIDGSRVEQLAPTFIPHYHNLALHPEPEPKAT